MMPVSAPSRSSQLADRIESAIVQGRILPGARLGTKETLRHSYGVAYGTLNEALRVLQQRGYVMLRSGPGGGAFAAMPEMSARLSGLLLNFDQTATFADCAAVRRALGKRIIVDAAGARSESDVRELRAIVDELAACVDDDARYGEQIRRFHRRLAQIERNPVLATLYTVLDGIRELRRRPGAGGDVRGRNLAVHREIVEAIASGSVERAASAAEAHESTYRTRHSRHPVDAQAARRRARRRRHPGNITTMRPNDECSEPENDPPAESGDRPDMLLQEAADLGASGENGREAFSELFGPEPDR